jgi:hypothetical protein
LNGAEAPGQVVIHVAVMGGVERIAMTRSYGHLVLWERSSSIERKWSIVFSISGGKVSSPCSSYISRSGSLSIGRDSTRRIALCSSHAGGLMDIYSERFEVPRTHVPKRITMSRVARREPSTERRVAASPGERLCNGLFDATQIVRYDKCLHGPNVNWNSV